MKNLTNGSSHLQEYWIGGYAFSGPDIQVFYRDYSEKKPKSGMLVLSNG